MEPKISKLKLSDNADRRDSGHAAKRRDNDYRLRTTDDVSRTKSHACNWTGSMEGTGDW
jgi:hypothetical protein